jgi:hypothetical protein
MQYITLKRGGRGEPVLLYLQRERGEERAAHARRGGVLGRIVRKSGMGKSKAKVFRVSNFGLN